MLKQTLKVSRVPNLDSDEILLEATSLAEAQALFDFNDRDIAKTVRWENRGSSEDAPQSVYWIAKSKANHQVVGIIAMTELDAVRAQIDYLFHYDHWNRRDPMEALDLVLDSVFKEYPHLQRIEARCLPASSSSRELLEGLGFQFEGVNRSVAEVRGVLVDLTCYAVIRSQWNQLRTEVPHYYQMAEHI